jgi:hypothetical protein
MDWQSFVGEEGVVRMDESARGHNYTLLAVVNETVEHSTLANWVRETNKVLSSGRQLTLKMFI